MVKKPVGTGGQPPRRPFDPYALGESLLNARRRIQLNRRRLTQAEAESIVREETNARAVDVPGHFVRLFARNALRSAWWPILNPIQARREGYRFKWNQKSE